MAAKSTRAAGILAVFAAVFALIGAGTEYFRHGSLNWFEILPAIVFLCLGVYWLQQRAPAA